jgi:hypothetical protein
MSSDLRVLVALLACGCASAEPAEPPEAQRGASTDWRACRVATDCTWTIGAGGWPVAVRGENVSVHRDWIESQAPFTTYWMPGDCFARTEQFEAYVARSRSSVACLGGACALALEPICTR